MEEGLPGVLAGAGLGGSPAGTSSTAGEGEAPPWPAPGASEAGGAGLTGCGSAAGWAAGGLPAGEGAGAGAGRAGGLLAAGEGAGPAAGGPTGRAMVDGLAKVFMAGAGLEGSPTGELGWLEGPTGPAGRLEDPCDTSPPPCTPKLVGRCESRRAVPDCRVRDRTV